MAVNLLNSLGYRTIQAENATMALASIDSGEEFDLLFTDIIMPGGMNGLELAREVRRRIPTMPIIFTTGFSNPDAVGSEAKALGASVVTKPFRKVVLAEAVRQKLDELRKTAG
jgi:two-component system, NtrC family, sensor kinase